MEVSDQIIKVLDDLSTRFGVAVDWTAANVMPIVTELCGKYIKWEIGSSIAWLIIGGLMLIVSILLCYTACRIWNVKDGLDICCALGSAIFGLIGLCVIGHQIFDIIKCVTFPELQIYEYIHDLLVSQ